MDNTTRRSSSQVTQPIEITAEMRAWGELAIARQAAKAAPSVVSVLATSTYTVRTRSHNVTMPL